MHLGRGERGDVGRTTSAGRRAWLAVDVRGAMRVSDKQREAAADVLRRRCGEGYLSIDTLVRRLDDVWAARDAVALQRPLADLPPSGWATRIDELRDRLKTIRAASAHEDDADVVLRLPRARERPAVLGRSSRCDIVVDHPSVSRRHAEVTWTGSAWRLLDLGSLNGTWLGARRLGEVEVPPGDGVFLGAQLVRLT